MEHKNELHIKAPVCPLLTIAAVISGQGMSRCLEEDCRLWNPVDQCCCLEYLSGIASGE